MTNNWLKPMLYSSNKNSSSIYRAINASLSSIVAVARFSALASKHLQTSHTKHTFWLAVCNICYICEREFVHFKTSDIVMLIKYFWVWQPGIRSTVTTRKDGGTKKSAVPLSQSGILLWHGMEPVRYLQDEIFLYTRVLSCLQGRYECNHHRRQWWLP